MITRLCAVLMWWQRLWRRLRVVRLVVVFAVLGVVSTVMATWAMAWWATSDPRRLSLTKDEEIACATVTVTEDLSLRSQAVPKPSIQPIRIVFTNVAFGWPWRTMDLTMRTADHGRSIGLVQAGDGSSYVATMDYRIGQLGTSVAGKWMATVCLPLRPIPAGFVAFSLIMSAAWFVLWFSLRRSLRGRSEARYAEGGWGLAWLFVVGRVAKYALAGFMLSVACAWWMGWNRKLDTAKLPPTRTGVVSSNDLDKQARGFLFSGVWTGPVVPVWHDVERAVWRGLGYTITELKPGKRTMMSDGQLDVHLGFVGEREWIKREFGLPLPAMSWENSIMNTAEYTFGGGTIVEMAEGLRGGVQLCLPGDQPSAAYWEQAMRDRLPLAIEPLPMVFNTVFWGGGLWLVVWGSRRLVDRHHARTGSCTSCGYDARGLARCPECGGEMTNAQNAPANQGPVLFPAAGGGGA
ncbi:MAG: hypothetical protein IBJ18_12780 [Phycisphaerales bacterium]|nr:hypothetical protein [Phycisphaerales bacterium]